MPSSPVQSRAVNAAVQQRVNRLILEYVRMIASGSMMAGQTHRPPTLAFEGIEVAGLDEWDPASPAWQLDLSAIQSPWPLALYNGELRVRRFEPVAEEELVVVLDLSRSMRFPLRRYYGDEAFEAEVGDLAAAKPSLMKLAAGAMVAIAAARGFTIRVVTFGHHGIDLGQATRSAREPLTQLFREVDRRFTKLTATPPVRESASYADVLMRLEQRRAMFVFLGDFLDGAAAQADPVEKRRWRRTLELFRDLATRRRVAVVRVNHWDEVRPPPDQTFFRLKPTWHDRCDAPETGAVNYDGQEHEHEAVLRLKAQANWQALLAATLTSRCRAYLSIHNKTRPLTAGRQLRDVWRRLVE